MFEFRWNSSNAEHIEEHGVSWQEAQYVVNHARAPYPEYRGDGKWLVIGQTARGAYIQVIFIVDSEDVVFVIHSRPLTDKEKKRFRRRKR